MYLFYALYVLSGALQTESSPVAPTTSDVDVGNLGNLDKIPFGEPCTAFGYTGVVTFEKVGDTGCVYGISAAEGVWPTSVWQFQAYHMDGSDNPWQLAAGKTCCIKQACAAPYDKSFCRNNYKAREVAQSYRNLFTQGWPIINIGIAVATDEGSPFIATGKEKLLCPQLGRGNPTSCWMKPTDPIPPPKTPIGKHAENDTPDQNSVAQTPDTDSSVDSALDPSLKSAFNTQSQPADYTIQGGTAGLSGILPAINQQNQAPSTPIQGATAEVPAILPATNQQNPVPYTPIQGTTSEVPAIQPAASQPNQVSYNDFQLDNLDLSSIFPATE